MLNIQQRKYIRDAFTKRDDATANIIANEMGINANTVRRYARAYGFVIHSHNDWNEDEDNKIIEHLPTENRYNLSRSLVPVLTRHTFSSIIERSRMLEERLFPEEARKYKKGPL